MRCSQSGKSCVLRQKSLDEQRHVSNFEPSIDCTQSDDQGGACVSSRTKKKVSCACF